MLIQFGGAGAKRDAVDLFIECHARIRHFTAVARRLSEARGAPESDIHQAAASVHRYFSAALPLHARDEEESVLPRLRGIEADVDQALAEMSREHAEHEAGIRRVLELCALIRDEPSRQQALAESFEAAVGTLERQFVAHLEREEAVIFPAMRRLLSAEIDAAIVAEIRSRRQTGGPGSGGAARGDGD